MHTNLRNENETIQDATGARRSGAPTVDETPTFEPGLSPPPLAARLSTGSLWPVIDALDCGVALYDHRRRLVAANRVCLSLLGGLDPADFFAHPSCPDTLDVQLARETPVVWELGLDGGPEPTWLGVKVTPLAPGPHGAAGLIVQLQDRTERRRDEEQLARAQHLVGLGTLAAGVVHDFNNLLTSILGHATVLKMDATPPGAVMRSADIIERAAFRASELSRQLLRLGRSRNVEKGPVRLNAAVREVLSFVEQELAGRVQVSRRLSLAGSVVHGDENQIRQILMNLVVNAGDAMPDGGALTVSTDRVEGIEIAAATGAPVAPGCYVRVRVQDTGVGIPPEVLAHIFEPFYSTKSSTDRTGMGLSVVQRLTQRHGGMLTVQSTVGEGTTFDVYLPVRRQDECDGGEA